MGNFEKLGVLVIVILVVVIVVLAIGGEMEVAQEDDSAYRGGDVLSAEVLNGPGGGGTRSPIGGGTGGKEIVDDDEDWKRDDNGFPVPAPVDPPLPPIREEEIVHVVKKDDTLSSLARQYYGEKASWKVIAEANPSVNPKAMALGTKLIIPHLDEDASSSDAPGPATGRSYVVKKGDSLWKIAESQLGNGSRQEELYRLNQDRIGTNRNALKLGIELRLP